MLFKDEKLLAGGEVYITAATIDRTKDQLYFATRGGLHRGYNLKGQQWVPEGGGEGVQSRRREEFRDPLLSDSEYSYGFASDENAYNLADTNRDEINRGDIDTLLRSDAGYKNIIAIEHLVLTNELCIASSDGNVWSYKLDSGAVEEVTHCQHGIEAMQWSPDQEVVVFVDMRYEITTMSKGTFKDVRLNDEQKTKVHEKNASKCNRKKFKISKEDTVVVKKRTMSKGMFKDVRLNDEQKTKVHKKNASKCNRKQFKISKEKDTNVFKVFNKKGDLQHTSECFEGLSNALAWQPSGKWIAMPQVVRGKFVIALFDKSGFRHQEIKTPLASQSEILSLQWSPASEVLAVVWSSLGMPNEYVAMRIRFDFRVDRSVGHGEDDEAMIAVIDGTNVCLSSFRRSIMPPPMCNYILTIPQIPDDAVPTCVNAVGFIRCPGKSANLEEDVSANAFFVVDSWNVITLYDIKVTKQSIDGGPMRTVLSAVNTLFRLDPNRDPYCEPSESLLHCLWINPDHFVLSCNNFLVALCISRSSLQFQDYLYIEDDSNEPFVDNETIGSVEALGPDKVLIELTSGRLMVVGRFIVGKPCSMSYERFSTKLYGTLPEFCEQLFVSKQRSTPTVYAFSESHRNLYHNGTLLAAEVTSVFQAKTYLLFTTKTALKFVPLQGAPSSTIVGERPLEVGSRLVTVIPKPSRIVFQRLAGDLVAINPHNLSLCLITKHLEALEYQEAFKIMRKERINLNLLVDHDPERFLARLGSHFLPQMTNVSWLNLFITDLANEDVCRTMYERNYPGREVAPKALTTSSSGGYSVEGKMQFICDRLLDMMDSNPTVLTQPKITCHVKQGQLEKALSLIWTLKRDQPTLELAENALRHLLNLTEPNVLYDVALGTYDLDLARFVADISKKNPKEYLPFLNALKRYDEHYRKYRIDCQLKRYDRAVTHISHSSRISKERSREVVELIFNHDLYTVGIEYFRQSGNEEHLRKICEQYAYRLRKTGKHAEASLMYERTGDIQQAISSARHALDWRRVLRLSARSMDLDAVRPVLRSLVPALIKAGDYEAAATIAHKHLNDIQLAVDCLLKGFQFERALFVAISGGKKLARELHKTIKEKLRQYLNQHITTLSSDKEQFLRQKERLAVVRELGKRTQGLDVGEDEGDYGECDLFSDSSNDACSCRRSGQPQRSAKKRRIEERKLLSLKEGSPFEDLALIDALHVLILRVCCVERQHHIRSICQVAFEFGFDTEARTIQRDHEGLIQLIQHSMDTIWIPEMMVRGRLPTSEPATGKTFSSLLHPQATQRYALLATLTNLSRNRTSEKSKFCYGGNAGYKNIIAIEHLVLTNELCIASSNGNVWSYKLDSGAVEEVTHCQHGIEAMQWSPDQEVVVFVDKKLNVVTMIGSEYEPINEVQLKEDTFGDRAFMSVGWGKKETQFRGSEGKATAKKPKNNEPDDEQQSDDDDQIREEDPYTCISWRADGEFFAVSYEAPGGQRAFKVFNKEGTLQYTSERCQNLYSAIAWRPSGQWIAMPQIVGEKFVIALFEKNGLRHREIETDLTTKDNEIISLHWSPDSEVLAVVWYTPGEQDSNVFLYVMGNYHWYLKQHLPYPCNVYGVQWDQRHSAGKTLHFLTNARYYERIRFDFRVDRSVGHGEDDEALVAVIDGRKLCLSSFRRSIIPPPMCNYTLTLPDEKEGPLDEFPKCINAVGFIRFPGKWKLDTDVEEDASVNAFYVIDSYNFVRFYDVSLTEEGEENGPKRTVLSGVKCLLRLAPLDDASSGEFYDILIHGLWVNPNHFVLCRNAKFVELIRNSFKRDKQYYVKIDYNSAEINPENESIGCVEALESDKVLIELTSGRLLMVEGFKEDVMPAWKKNSFPIKLHSTLPEFCEQLFVDRQRPTPIVYAFSQSRRNLYHSGTLLASEVTSAFLAEAYLLFTTIAELKFVPLGDAPGGTIVGERRLERGSKLVTVVPKASRTVFQLPRGNLEAINPRVLSLCLIAKHLEALEYHEAFDIMRKERINLNLLVDHDPERFLANLGSHFIPQITNVSWLNLFITDLANEDVCRTMYESNYPGRQLTSVNSGGYSVEGKIQFICDRLLDVMDSNPTVLTQPKITCHVKQGQLEKALSLIWTLKRDQPTPELAEQALRYLLYLVEVNVLYDVALGMYDFGLVLFVATKSQKDPKEYLPFLNELKRYDEHYRKFRIDCHLKRYDRALEHISRCEANDERLREALELIVTHDLYTVGIECYRTSGNEQHLQKIREQYADHLRKKGKHAEASLMYERTGDIQQAISSARHALDWRRVLRLSARSMDLEAVRPVLRSLVPALVEAGDYDGAATIAHEHLNDVRLAVDSLLKGFQYERALLVAISGENELARELHETIKENLHQYLNQLINVLSTDKGQFLHQKERLAAVREAREKARTVGSADQGDVDGEGDCGDCDLFSDSSTVASSRHTSSSGRSGKSHRSSKNRRKHERKLLNLKEGNQFEDLALIDALHGHVLQLCSVEKQRHVRSICQVALELGFDVEARTIQREYAALFQLIRYSLDAIWIPEMIVPGSGPSATGEPTTIQTPADLLQAQAAQRYALIKPHQRYKPDIQLIAWQWDILK
ncbi:AGAP003979-PA-like protein [Anopheles sinensis]|uniref:Elongator complex protein 1 n=1 Tax=Anopheles sinensis TaxID=74873 RepID=A0A084W5A5_ANOSI|nr:AGAP003979-PA-like protein [Anopheles sinensis]